MQYRKCLILFFSFLPFFLCAQDITGLWKGTLYNDTTGQYYKYEIGISNEKGKLAGFSHTWFILEDKQYYGVKKVKIKIAADGKILVEDDGLIANNYPIAPNKNVRQLNVLTLDATGSVMTLSGTFSTNRTKEYHSLTGTVELQRKNDFWQSALVPHLQELGKENELSFVKADADVKEQAERQRLLADKELAKQHDAGKIAAKLKTDADSKAAAQVKEQAEAKQKASDQAAVEKAKQIKLQRAEEEKAMLRKIDAEMAAAEKERQLAEQKLVAATKQQNEKEERVRKEEIRGLQKEKEENELLAKKATLAKTETERQQLTLETQRLETEKAIKKEQAALLVKKERDHKIAVEAEKLALAKIETEQGEAAEREARNREVEAKELTLKVAQQKNVSSQNSTTAVASAPAQNVHERKTVLQQTVSFSSDSLMLSLYDNGEVDGDTVSVLMNGNLIIAKQGLSTNAIKKTIYIPANTDIVELIMYAETLGSIPPNTGLLVIRDGKSIYEIRFSGDMQKNASIVFNRRKE